MYPVGIWALVPSEKRNLQRILWSMSLVEGVTPCHMILFDISMILESHMTCLHKHQNILIWLLTSLHHHLFLAHHVTSGHVTHHVTFPTLSLLYIPAGVGFCSLSFSPISCSDFNKSDSSYHVPPVGSEVMTLVPIEEDEVCPLSFLQCFVLLTEMTLDLSCS